MGVPYAYGECKLKSPDAPEAKYVTYNGEYKLVFLSVSQEDLVTYGEYDLRFSSVSQEKFVSHNGTR